VLTSGGDSDDWLVVYGEVEPVDDEVQLLARFGAFVVASTMPSRDDDLWRSTTFVNRPPASGGESQLLGISDSRLP
jgi:hypothetical protein